MPDIGIDSVFIFLSVCYKELEAKKAVFFPGGYYHVRRQNCYHFIHP